MRTSATNAKSQSRALTIYDLHSHNSKCCFWHKGEGGLDAYKFATFLLVYVNNNERCKAASTIILYSDRRSYQNRNKGLANGLYDFCCKNKKTFFQKTHKWNVIAYKLSVCEKINVPSNNKMYIEKARPKQLQVPEARLLKDVQG